MGIPTGLPLHFISLQGFKPAKNILDGAGHYVVDPRHSIRAGWTFVKSICFLAFAGANGFLEGVVRFPEFQYLLVDLRQIELLIRLIYLFTHGFAIFYKGAKIIKRLKTASL